MCEKIKGVPLARSRKERRYRNVRPGSNAQSTACEAIVVSLGPPLSFAKVLVPFLMSLRSSSSVYNISSSSSEPGLEELLEVPFLLSENDGAAEMVGSV